MLLKSVVILVVFSCCSGQYYLGNNRFSQMKEVFSWKQIGYDFDGVKYVKDEPLRRIPEGILFQEDVEENEKFFIQYNNIPVGFEVYKDKAFITVPFRRYGIPSTLNYVDLKSSGCSSPLLKPYPSVAKVGEFVSVYRPRVDACDRLWMVDTGLLEQPGNFRQIRPPLIIIYDLKTDTELLRYEIPYDNVVNGTTSGLTSITVDVTASTCDDAYAYINDLARNGMIVFSLKDRASWRFEHSSFVFDEATDFRVRSMELNWRDGLFSIALSDPDSSGKRKAYYHPLVSTQEFSITNDILKNSTADFGANFKLEGVRGASSPSGSHDYHSATQTLLYANVMQDGIMCWNTRHKLISKISVLVAQSHTKLVYIADLKVRGDEVWVLSNQITNFIYGTLNIIEPNFFVHKAKVQDLIKGTVCEH